MIFENNIDCTSPKCNDILDNPELQKKYNIEIVNGGFVIPIIISDNVIFKILRKTEKRTAAEGRYSWIKTTAVNPYDYYFSHNGFIDFTINEINIFEGVLDVIVYGEIIRNAITSFGFLNEYVKYFISKFSKIAVWIDKDSHGYNFGEKMREYCMKSNKQIKIITMEKRNE